MSRGDPIWYLPAISRPENKSPQMNPSSSTMSISQQRSISSQTPSFSSATDEGRISVSIDFGTMFTGVAYRSSRSGKVQQLLHGTEFFHPFRKVPTCLLYDDEGHLLAWGFEAMNASPVPGMLRCEWFKLALEPHILRDKSALHLDPRLPRIPPDKRAVDLIVDFLSSLWEYAKEQITREIGAVADLDKADVCLTVPAAWGTKECKMMRAAAIAAGLVHASRAREHNWTDRLRIITEPEAAALHCLGLTELHHLKPSQNFIICDAGGRTVELAAYKVLGLLENLEIAQIAVPSGANCGSYFLDLRFRRLVEALLSNHSTHSDESSLVKFTREFSEIDKLAYRGESDDNTAFRFTCFNVEDTDDPNVGLVNGELVILGKILRNEVFDPIVNQVLELIEEQLKKISEPLGALLLVGGFSCNEYLFKKVDTQFGHRIKVIARPLDADTSTARGAAQYGLTQGSQGIYYARSDTSTTSVSRLFADNLLTWEHMSVAGLPEEFRNNPGEYLIDVVNSLLAGLRNWSLLPLKHIAAGLPIIGPPEPSDSAVATSAPRQKPSDQQIKRTYLPDSTKTEEQVTDEVLFRAIALQYTLSSHKSLENILFVAHQLEEIQGRLQYIGMPMKYLTEGDVQVAEVASHAYPTVVHCRMFPAGVLKSAKKSLALVAEYSDQVGNAMGPRARASLLGHKYILLCFLHDQEHGRPILDETVAIYRSIMDTEPHMALLPLFIFLDTISILSCDLPSFAYHPQIDMWKNNVHKGSTSFFEEFTTLLKNLFPGHLKIAYGIVDSKIHKHDRHVHKIPSSASQTCITSPINQHPQRIQANRNSPSETPNVNTVMREPSRAASAPASQNPQPDVSVDLSGKTVHFSNRDIESPAVTKKTLRKPKFDPAQIPNLTGSIKIIKGPLYAGGFCDIYSGELISERGAEPVAMKMLRVFSREALVVAAKKDFRKEVSVWCSLKHRYVLPFFGTCEFDEFRLFMVSPWAEGGNSLEYLRRNPSADRRRLLWQTSSALEYLHSGQDAPQVVHGDLKADNVLISATGDALLCDFGLSRQVEEIASRSGSASASRPGGHARFMAPELLLPPLKDVRTRPTRESDVFAFASLMLQIYTEKLPFGDLLEAQAILNVAHGILPPQPLEPIVLKRGCDKDVWRLMVECWQFEPCKRPSMQQIRRQMVARRSRVTHTL